MLHPWIRKKILVYEDELLIYLDLKTIVERIGCVAFRAAISGDAFSLIQGVGIDGAMLDYQLLAGATSDDVAEELIKRGIPFVFVTARPKEFLPPRFAHIPALEKPIDSRAIERAVQDMFSP